MSRELIILSYTTLGKFHFQTQKRPMITKRMWTKAIQMSQIVSKKSSLVITSIAEKICFVKKKLF